MTARTGHGRVTLPVRDGPAKEPRITRQAAIRTHTGHRENRLFQQPFALRPSDIAALTLRTMGLHRPLPDPPTTTGHHPRTPPRKSSVHFCTPLSGFG